MEYETTMKCPVCGAIYHPVKGNRGSFEQRNNNYREETTIISPPSPSSPTCRRCKADLYDLLRLHDQAIWYHRQGMHLLSQEHYLEAAAHNNQALALYYSNADFHALAGKLSALQGEWREAIASWQQALKFNPENAIASNCLQTIELMAKNYDSSG